MTPAQHAHRRRVTGRRGDRITSADRVEQENAVTADYMIGPVDRLASQMERKWGIDRLPDLVAPELAERFGRQKERFERLLIATPLDLDAIRTEAQRMANAYRALDRAATEAGAPQAHPEAWEFVDADGQVCAVIRDGAHWLAYADANPGVRVYTLDEISRIVSFDAMRLANCAKDTFPGATVTAVRPAQSRIGALVDDEIPFRQEDR